MAADAKINDRADRQSMLERVNKQLEDDALAREMFGELDRIAQRKPKNVSQKEETVSPGNEIDPYLRARQEAADTTGELIYQDTARQLEAAGVHDTEQRSAFARLMQQVMVTQAKNAGMSPHEFYRQFGAQIIGGARGESDGFAQPTVTKEEAVSRWQKALRQVTPHNLDYAPHFSTPSALKHMGIVENIIPLPVRVIKQILNKHRDIPDGVIRNLPALLADPLLIYPHRDGGLNIAIDAQTVKGEPIVVGVRENRIRTITPLHDNEGTTGMNRLIAHFSDALFSGEKVYAKNEKALDEARAFNRGTDGNNRRGRNTQSRIRLSTRDDLVKQYGEPFYQGNKGQFSPDSRIISLFQSTDASTFLHESGHYFLDLYSRMIDAGVAPEGVRRDMQSLMDWFGVKSFDDWRRLSIDEQRPYHEQFAKGFETYLAEGKAPNERLRGLFEQFKAWLKQVYNDVQGALGVHLTDDVRGVMDRIIDTPEPRHEPHAEEIPELSAVRQLLETRGDEMITYRDEDGNETTATLRDLLDEVDQDVKDSNQLDSALQAAITCFMRYGDNA